jgi:hypothetical protein
VIYGVVEANSSYCFDVPAGAADANFASPRSSPTTRGQHFIVANPQRQKQAKPVFTAETRRNAKLKMQNAKEGRAVLNFAF